MLFSARTGWQAPGGWQPEGLTEGVVIPQLAVKSLKSRQDFYRISTLHFQYSCVNLDDTQAEPPSQEIWYQATPRLS